MPIRTAFVQERKHSTGANVDLSRPCGLEQMFFEAVSTAEGSPQDRRRKEIEISIGGGSTASKSDCRGLTLSTKEVYPDVSAVAATSTIDHP